MKAALMSLQGTSSKWVYEEMKKLFDDVDFLNIKKIKIEFDRKSNIKILYNNNELKDYDAIYLRGSFRYAKTLRAITEIYYENSYMPIKPDAFTIVHDKFLTQLILQANRIPMPNTTVVSSTEDAKEVLKEIKYPCIIKVPSGTQGKGTMFAESFPAASSMIDAISPLKSPILIQEFIDTETPDSGVKDLRIIVAGNKVIATMQRIAQTGEKRANIHIGGIGVKTEINKKTEEIAVKTAKILGMEVGAIDILESIYGPLVLEANLSPGLKGITEATKENIAEKIAKYIYDRADSRKRQKENIDSEELFNLGKKIGQEKTIITNLDFRGKKILLPEFVNTICKFEENKDVNIELKLKELKIKQD